MMQECQTKIGNEAIVLAEDQNEVYIGDVDIFLTLFGFRRSEALYMQPATAYQGVPAYQAIYGGYAMFVGAEFDYEKGKEEVVRRLAGQFIFGVQLGWSEVYNMSPLLDHSNDDLVLYIQKINSAKRVANSYFVHGRVMRELPHQTHLPPASVISMPWLSADGSSLIIPILTVHNEGKYNVKMTLDLSKYGFDNKESDKFFNLNKLSAYEGQNPEFMGSFIGKEIKIDI